MTRLRLLATVAAWVILSIALWLSDADPAVIPLAGIVAVIAAAGLVAVDLGTSVQQVHWPAPTTWDPSATVAGSDTTRTLRYVDMAVRSNSRELHDRIVELVDDRVLAHHDIDRRVDPHAADQLLSPAIRRFLDGPQRRITDRELQTVLNEIEAL
jgi:hypothetical protein